MNDISIGRAAYQDIINRYFTPTQARLVMLAYRFAKYGHRGQERDGGGRYFDHPRAVSLLLVEQGVYDHEIIISALLHDVMEDSYLLTWEDLEYIFGSRVCAIVKLLTKEPGLAKEEYIPRLLNGLPEAQLVKLADRLHNMSTLDTCLREKQLKQIKETREKIMPVCQKLSEDPRYARLAVWFEQQLEQKCRDFE